MSVALPCLAPCPRRSRPTSADASSPPSTAGHPGRCRRAVRRPPDDGQPARPTPPPNRPAHADTLPSRTARHLSDDDDRPIAAIADAECDLTLGEIAVRFEAKTGRSVGERSVRRSLLRLGYTRKKAMTASSASGPMWSRSARPLPTFNRPGRRRARVGRRVRHQCPLVHRYGWARSAARVRPRPSGVGQGTTLTGAMTPSGCSCSTAASAWDDKGALSAFVREVLCPALRPGQVVVLDNLNAHRAPEVAEPIRAVDPMCSSCRRTARIQCHREGVVEAEDPAASDRGADAERAHGGRSPRLRRRSRRRRSELDSVPDTDYLSAIRSSASTQPF